MEVEIISSGTIANRNKEGEETDDMQLPGFRFHPTEEELISFYLKRKVEKKPFSVDLIKQADIYKYDPWDLLKCSNGGGEKEWYFFCQRGRKYRNSIRPNRVTGSGFWKATGIDRPIYSSSDSGSGSDIIIGLKKSLVYYRGSAGKGTKTDWMMHEFRLPAPHDKAARHLDAKTAAVAQAEAEIWTLCRIFKRSVSYRKCIPDWRSAGGPKRTAALDSSSKTCSSNSSISSAKPISYISFNNYGSSPLLQPHAAAIPNVHNLPAAGHHRHFRSSPPPSSSSSALSEVPSGAASSQSFSGSGCGDIGEFLWHGADWDDLRAVIVGCDAPVADDSANTFCL